MKPPSSLSLPGDAWRSLRQFTRARIALDRTGASLSTQDVLAFDMAHARARDAVHAALDVTSLQAELTAAGWTSLAVCSRASTRALYLQRPDLGRSLSPASALEIQSPQAPENRLTVIFADGLSSLAVARHAIPLLQALAPKLSGWQLDQILLATQARVALGDEIGSLRHSRAVLLMIGERPGLSCPDSLGLYLTYAPRPGMTDAERNCISNVHPGGLSYEEAAARLSYLLQQSHQLGRSGVDVKDLSKLSDADALPTAE